MTNKHPFPPVLKDRVVVPRLGWRRWLRVAGHWLGALLPALMVMGAALLVFREAVVASILSTPHPELVYAILGTYGVGVLLTSVTLARFTLEGNLLYRWSHARAHQRARLLSDVRWRTYLQSLFELLLAERRLHAPHSQSVIAHEIAAVNERFSDRLALPNYLAGALVGLGLVGTFVGLLGTLEDLGKLFGGLVQSGAGSTNPADLFSDMVRRLQDPMRGMGTAFVASLYGLLGSLVLGLQILAVGKVGHGVIHQLQRLMHTRDNRTAQATTHTRWSARGPANVDEDEDAMPQGNDGPAAGQARSLQAVQEWQDLLRVQQTQHQQETDALRRELLNVIQASQAQTRQILNQVASVNQNHQTLMVDVLSDIAITLQNVEQRIRKPAPHSFH